MKKTIKQEPARAKTRTRRYPPEVRDAINTLRVATAKAELEAAHARAAARRQINAIARDLMPTAAGYARKGRPRLLAVLAKILGDDNLNANLHAIQTLERLK